MQKIFQNLPKEVLDICMAIAYEGGEGLLVGGCVRDEYFNLIHGTQLDSKDIDIEVFGVEEKELVPILKSFGTLVITGEETDKFKVFKLKTSTDDYDFNLPRTETKVGQGHNDYDIEVDIDLPLAKAAERRDLTINAIYYDPLTQLTEDPFNGVSDIRKRIARHTTEKFAEDALRVLRIMQFVSRFNLSVAIPTIMLCEGLLDEFVHLSKERVWEEFSKMCTKGSHMGKAMGFLSSCRWVRKFPQIITIIKNYTWTDTCHFMEDVAIKNNYFRRDSETRLVLVLAALCYNMDKPQDFLTQIDAPNKISKTVLNLVKVRKAVLAVYDCDELYEYKKALVKLKVSRELFGHFMASSPSWTYGKLGLFFRLNHLITDESLQKRVTGEDLIARGWKQGRELGQELERLFELQLKHNYLKKDLLSMVANDIYNKKQK